MLVTCCWENTFEVTVRVNIDLLNACNLLLGDRFWSHCKCKYWSRHILVKASTQKIPWIRNTTGSRIPYCDKYTHTCTHTHTHIYTESEREIYNHVVIKRQSLCLQFVVMKRQSLCLHSCVPIFSAFYCRSCRIQWIAKCKSWHCGC